MQLNNKAIKLLLIFSMAYVCKKRFSALSLIKTKEKNCVDIQAVLRPEASEKFLAGKGQDINKSRFFWLNRKKL